MQFVDFRKGFTETQACSSAPKWARVDRGLVIEGECENPNCIAKNKMVRCNLGFGKLNIINERYRVVCPICNKPVQPELAGFKNCSFTIVGETMDDNVMLSREGHALDAYTTLNKAKSGKAVFTTLVIMTYPLRTDEQKFDSSLETI